MKYESCNNDAIVVIMFSLLLEKMHRLITCKFATINGDRSSYNLMFEREKNKEREIFNWNGDVIWWEKIHKWNDAHKNKG